MSPPEWASSPHTRALHRVATHPDVLHLATLQAGERQDARDRAHAAGDVAPHDDPLRGHYGALPPALSPGDALAAFLSSWAVSPTYARGLQNAAQGVFHMPHLHDRPDTQEHDPAYRAHRRFLRALYEQTQQDLRSGGGGAAHVLYRPLYGRAPAGGQVRVQMAPLSNWTDRQDLAARAARLRASKTGDAALLMISVSPLQLLATPRTGGMSGLTHAVGGGHESEYVVIGRVTPGLVTVLAGASSAAPHGTTSRSRGRRMSDDEALPIIQPDATLENADWLRALHWGIHPSTADGLLEALGVAEGPRSEQHAAILHFLTLPAAQAMPASVRSGLITRGLASPYDLLPADQQDEDEESGSTTDPALEAARQAALREGAGAADQQQ